MNYDVNEAADTYYDKWLPAFSESMLEAYADRFHTEITAALVEARASAFEEAAWEECEMCRAKMELVEGTEPMLEFVGEVWVEGKRRSTFHHRIPGMGGLWACLARKIHALALERKS